jgi:hypothetical protein
MAVTAKFVSDFTEFYSGIDKAVAKTDDFERSATKADKATKNWSTAFGQADSILQQVGVNVGGAGRAIDEISNAAGKSAKEIGLLGSAALVAGAAMAGWNFGRAIAGFLGLDEAIANGTATLLGWGDAIAQTSSAQTDTINAAIKNGAAATISYSEAIKFNTEFHKKRLAVVKESNKADEETKAAMVELNSAGATYQKTIEGLDGATVEAVKHYLDAGVSQGTLATAYGLTATQVNAVAQSLKAAETADKAWLEQMKASAAEAEAYRDVLAKLAKDGIDKTTAANEKSTRKLTEHTDGIRDLIIKNANAREDLNKSTQTYDTQTAAWMKMTQALADLEKKKKGDVDVSALQQKIYDEYTQTLYDEAVAHDKAAEAERKAREEKDKHTAATEKATKATGVYMNQLHMLVDDPRLAAFFGGNAVATTLYSGGKGGFTPEEAAAIASGQFINFAGSGIATGRAGFGATIINITQPLGTPDAIARAVGNALTGQARATGARL